ncbi:unnamed protein product [Brugia timori]|uniref:Uncharacterized protein n=1 Tax=Brugia timori TaxID=42155 RepID=A0A0R3RC80_9BILA|nr:unnamed protein product [Brugia timori]
MNSFVRCPEINEVCLLLFPETSFIPLLFSFHVWEIL